MLPIIGKGLGPGGSGKDVADFRRVTTYTAINSPTMAVYIT
jgi:hypothetical protein